jgi:hypothetical protein
MSYTPPAPDSIGYSLQGYTPPVANSIEFELSAGGSGSTLSPTLFTNSQAFFAATITTAVVLSATLFSNPSAAFPSAAVTRGTVALATPVVTNTSTFYAASVSPGTVALAQASRYNSANTFYTPVIVPGSVALTAARFNASSTFYAGTVIPGTVVCSPTRLNNINTFYSAVATLGPVVLSPVRFNSANSFYSAVVTPGGVSITPLLFANTQGYYGHAITPGVVTLTPVRLNASTVFYTSTVAVGASVLTPARFNNTNGFYGSVVTPGAVSLTPALVNNNSEFYVSVVTPGTVTLSTSLLDNSNSLYIPTVEAEGGDKFVFASRLNNTNGFFGHVMIRGIVGVEVPYYTNLSGFYASNVTVEERLFAELYGASNVFYSHEVSTSAPTLSASRVNNSNEFYGPTVIRGTVDLTTGSVINSSTFYPPIVYGEGQHTALTAARFNNTNQFRWFSIFNGELDSCAQGICGVGGWTGPLPGDPDNNVVLSAVSAFGGIDVTWTYPQTHPEAVAHTLLFRNTAPTLGGAIQVAVVAGNFFYDKLDVGTTYYYWIQIVSVNGTTAAPIGPASAQARPLIEAMIEKLTGEIDRGVLASSLKTELDQISTLNTNLANEIFDRETGLTSFAEALEQVNEGVADAMTFINNEIASRTSATEALAEAVDLVAVTLGTDIAAVNVNASAWITPLALANSKLNDIGALYTVQVTANDLVGGFGIYNNGTTIEAGFDVTRFWVGTTDANKRKPFIIENGITYIDEAAINKLTFNKLRSEDGAFIVQDGKIQGNYLTVKGLSVVNNLGVANFTVDMQGNAKFGGELVAATGEFAGTLRAGVVDLALTQGVTYDLKTVGAHYLTVPTGRTSMRVSIVGGGGGGGGGSSRTHFPYSGGGGGGGGFVTQTFSGLTAGTVIEVVVGSPGSPGAVRDGFYSTGGAGTAGGSTYVSGYVLVNGGGGGGQANNLPTGGASGGAFGEPGNNAEAVPVYTEWGNYNVFPGGRGGNSRWGTGGVGGMGDTGTSGQLGSGWGAGGGGGGQNSNNNLNGYNGAAGASGRAVIEFFDPNGVILRAEWNTLIAALQAQSIATS